MNDQARSFSEVISCCNGISLEHPLSEAQYGSSLTVLYGLCRYRMSKAHSANLTIWLQCSSRMMQQCSQTLQKYKPCPAFCDS